jgi:ACS family hexuronate transporter-like MFS transporter
MSFLVPSRRRWVILALLLCATLLNYFDRQIVSILKPLLKKEFEIDDRGYATLLNAFTFCYAFGYPIAGWVVDRISAGRAMFLSMIAWSSASLGAGLTSALGPFTFFRALLGLTEPMTFPSQLRIATAWFPPSIRSTAYSICGSGGTLGALIAPPIVAWLTLTLGWRSAFVVPAVLGLMLAAVWRLIYREPPPEVSKLAVGTEKIETIARFSWPQLWSRRTLWGVVLCRFVCDPVWYFCLFWMPGFLQERSGLTLSQAGMVAWIPFLVADLGGIGSSMLSDRLVRRGFTPLRARKFVLTGAAMLAPVCVLIPHVPHVAFTLAIFGVVGAVCSADWAVGAVAADRFGSAT